MEFQRKYADIFNTCVSWPTGTETPDCSNTQHSRFGTFSIVKGCAGPIFNNISGVGSSELFQRLDLRQSGVLSHAGRFGNLIFVRWARGVSATPRGSALRRKACDPSSSGIERESI